MAEFETDFSDVLLRMSNRGITHAISIGSLAQNERIEKTVEIINSYDFIFTALGVHPKSLYKDLPDIFKLFEHYYSANKKKVIAVGEIGLDYFMPKKNLGEVKTKQKELFKFQIGLASAYRLPIIVHVRDAYEDAIGILKDYVKSPDGFFGGVIHCFSSDDPAIAEEFIKMGFFISFSGNITYKKNEGLRAAVKNIPNEKILIETDSPYLAPAPFRGKRNEPSRVSLVLDTIAELKGVERGKLDALTVQNTVNLFSLNGISGFYPSVAYKIGNSVYVNLTNKCTNRCTFCPKYQNGKSNFNVRGYNLKLDKEPAVDEVVSSVFRYYDFKEVVFCGFGEPTLRIETLKSVAKTLKKIYADIHGCSDLKIRLDTDGLANAVYERNTVPELGGIIDSVSISLNAQNSEHYDRICNPQILKKRAKAYDSVLNFIGESKKYIKEVTVTAVDLPGTDIPYIANIAKKLGVDFRHRKYNKVG